MFGIVKSNRKSCQYAFLVLNILKFRFSIKKDFIYRFLCHVLRENILFFSNHIRCLVNEGH